MRLSWQPPRPLRSRDAPGSPCCSGRLVPPPRLCCAVDQQRVSRRLSGPSRDSSCKSGSAGNSIWPHTKARKWLHSKPRSTDCYAAQRCSLGVVWLHFGVVSGPFWAARAACWSALWQVSGVVGESGARRGSVAKSYRQKELCLSHSRSVAFSFASVPNYVRFCQNPTSCCTCTYGR
jgi:hypothetical protein